MAYCYVWPCGCLIHLTVACGVGLSVNPHVKSRLYSINWPLLDFPTVRLNALQPASLVFVPDESPFLTAAAPLGGCGEEA
jgi:hypothetical protein